MQYYSGPRDYDIPDTEDPEILKKLDFVSPKAGVYRPANPQSKGMGSGLLDFSQKMGIYRPANPQSKGMRVLDLFPPRRGSTDLLTHRVKVWGRRVLDYFILSELFSRTNMRRRIKYFL